VKSAVAAALAATVISIGFSVPLPAPSCQATTVYLPGGHVANGKTSVRRAHGEEGALHYADVGLHPGVLITLTGTSTSGRASLWVNGGAPFGWDWFQSGLLAGVKWILCVVGSLFLIVMS